MSGEIITGPWRATRLWNDIIRSFHSGIPLKRHRRRRGVRTVENCFTGSEAADWLHKHLQGNPNFGPDVTKEQTVQLLRKLLRANVIAPADDVEEKEDEEDLFSSAHLYQLVEDAAEKLRTPGKKSPEGDKRRVLASIGNTPKKSTSAKDLADKIRHDASSSSSPDTSGEQWESKSEPSTTTTTTTKTRKHPKYTVQMKQDLNRSYFQSLPPNSLIILDNDITWKNSFVSQLQTNLSEIHVRSLDVNVAHIIYNMTKVSDKGIVQLEPMDPSDLPTWVLSAMKCLANWPKPMRMLNGQDSTLPNYPAFIIDVFNVVKDYFLGSLGAPLIPYELFDIFISAHIKAEAVGAKVRYGSLHRHHRPPPPQCQKQQQQQQPVKTSTPTLASAMNDRKPNFYVMSDSANDDDRLQLNNDYAERVARIRSTMEVFPSSTSSLSNTAGSSSLEASASSSSGFVDDGKNRRPPPLHAGMSTTAIMRSFLPPNSCFETAFMHENPVTRIVPQKECESLHLLHYRSLSRSSCYTPISSSGWDTRSIATQTSQEEEEKKRQDVRRQPRWKRGSEGQQRKSIAVMEFPEVKKQGFVNPAYQVSPGRMDQTKSSGDLSRRREGHFSSVDNLFDCSRMQNDDSKRCQQQQQEQGKPARLSSAADNVILSKTVRKEKKKQRIKRERASSVDRVSIRHRSSSSSSGYVNHGIDHHARCPPPLSSSSSSSFVGCGTRGNLQQQQQIGGDYYYTSRYNNLTVKTPINATYVDVLPHGMQCVRAEPYREEERFTEEGVSSAVDSFKLLGLLLPPANRRKLQLLLKFMKRVSCNSQLSLVRDSTSSSSSSSSSKKNNLSTVLDTFTEAILKPQGMSRYDEELCRKIAKFFVYNYDDVWTPAVSLRREVEEKVYQSLVSKRIEAGEDPYPITFCQRVSTRVYNQEKTSEVRKAMQDLLDQILGSQKLNDKEKRKRLKRFRDAYSDIYRARFPREEDEPDFMRKKSNGNLSVMGKFSSLTKLRLAMRI